MTKPLGQHLLDDAIPEKYRPQGVYTKGALYKSMLRMAREEPELYAATIPKVKEIGDQVATLEGISVGLDDISPVYTHRDAIMKPAIKAFEKAKTREDRQKVVLDTQAKLVDYAKVHPGSLGDMARSGGRGNMIQLMKSVGAHVAANDEHDKVQPWLISRSYSEGLTPSQFWAANREARMAAVKTTIEVSEPGDLSKIIINNTSNQVVTKHDCGTRNGILLPTAGLDALDRYTARAEGKYPAETLITKRVLDDLRAAHSQVLVRSPMTCEAHTGVCQICMGHGVTGRLNQIGDNVGVRAAHALGEPLTQLALNAKHGVRTAGGTAGVSGIEGFRALVESPATFKHKAALAPRDGVVTEIEKAPQGGHYITVSGERVHVAPGLAVTVAKGTHVHAGDVLSEGTPRPDEVVRHKGLGAGREYIVGQLGKLYKDAGIDVDRRHFEILAKSTMNHLEVTRAEPNEHGIVRGDVIDFNRFKSLVQTAKKEVPIAEAEGKYLAAAAHEHLPGTLITPGLIHDLKRRGVRHVTVSTLDTQVAPILAPATRNPLLNPDWMARMGSRYLKNSLLEAAHQGHKTDIHNPHPVPSIVFNPDFGSGPDGTY